MAAAKKPVTIRISDEVLEGIEKHAYSLLTAEVGGMLMGKVRGKTTTIEGFIPALSASAEQVTLTFTHDVWEDILTIAAKDFPDLSIVGWYHTHPTFGIFLSEYDLFIQENFFAHNGNVALVIDPVQGLYGWFAKDSSGKVEPFEEGPTKTGPKRSVDPMFVDAGEPPRSGAKIAIAAIVGMVLGATIGGGVVATQIPPDLSGALISSRAETDEALQQTQQLMDSYEEVLNQPVMAYEIQPGDTLLEVITMFYDDFPSGRDMVFAVNGLDGSQPLPVGQWILIPGPTKLGMTGWSAPDLLSQFGFSPESETSSETQDESPAEGDVPEPDSSDTGETTNESDN
jgi:proteasome lid subunit RPN8/RPN11